ncbi:PREDICTED: chromosome alignment-maintaining phosphoprotein 1, partial [Condylura cristata]|uniref:chromosome alignment-maintaining phosphoprotein 1 n=1 Tax=Condylura cristata TaxID=143302 RepID=UPI000643C253
MEVARGRRDAPARLECGHCGFRGADHEDVQIHMGTLHPEFCDDMDAGGLGKVIFYQKSAKLFHCHRCFFTSKMYSSVYHHVTARHAAPGPWGEKPKHPLSREAEAVGSPPLSEHQKAAPNSAEPQRAPALPADTQRLGPALSPESPEAAPVPALEPQRPGPAASPGPQAPARASPESLKPAPGSSPELPRSAAVVSDPQKPVPVPSPEAHKLAPGSPDPVKAALLSPKPQKLSHFPEVLGPPAASSPESPVVAASPDSWGPSPSASPESRKLARTVSPEPRKPSPPESPEPWKPFPAASPEPRRPAPAGSPGSWKPGPPGSPRSWKSSPSAPSGPWKPAKPAPSVSPGPWKPIPSVSPGPWKATPSLSPASWKSSSVSPGSWKTPPTSPESWKSGPPELRRATPTLSPEPWKAAPPVSPELRKAGPPLSPELRKQGSPLSPEVRSPAGSPELRKPSGSPEVWKLSPDQRKPSPTSLDFPESQKSSRAGSPDLWKSSFFLEPQKPVFPEARKAGPSGPAEPPKVASDIWKSVLCLDAEARRPALCPEPPRAAPAAPPEPRKRSLFPEPRKHALFPDLPKPLLAESQRADATGEQKCDPLAQEELLATPQKLLEDALFPCPKRLKRDGQTADAEPGGSECAKADADAADAKGQESSSDQEQVDVESVDCGREGGPDAGGPARARQALQVTEEKEAFISEEEIAKYMKRGKGKYYCKICCCRAMKKGAVLHHLVNKHDVHSPYKCAICGKAFLLESLLKNHVAAHGQSLLRCPRCSFESNFPRGFKKHLTHCQSRHGEEAHRRLPDAPEPA